MILKYKNFEIKKDDNCYTITKKIEYEKRESLHGPTTGEIGEKEEIIGYYGSLVSMIMKLAELSADSENSMELGEYIKQVLKNQEEIKKLING